MKNSRLKKVSEKFKENNLEKEKGFINGTLMDIISEKINDKVEFEHTDEYLISVDLGEVKGKSERDIFSSLIKGGNLELIKNEIKDELEESGRFILYIHKDGIDEGISIKYRIGYPETFTDKSKKYSVEVERLAKEFIDVGSKKLSREVDKFFDVAEEKINKIKSEIDKK